MTTVAFHAMNMVAELRSRGVRFTETGPETEHLTTVERLSVQRQIEELGGMLTGPEAWPAVMGLETGWLEDLWRRLDDDATVLQDDFTERFEGISRGIRRSISDRWTSAAGLDRLSSTVS